jgi:hypothetical protein
MEVWRYIGCHKGRVAGTTGIVGIIFSFPCDPLREEEREARMETDVERIIADPTLSPEAKVILVTAEIEKQVREAANLLASMPDIEINLV